MPGIFAFIPSPSGGCTWFHDEYAPARLIAKERRPEGTPPTRTTTCYKNKNGACQVLVFMINNVSVLEESKTSIRMGEATSDMSVADLTHPPWTPPSPPLSL